MFVIYILLKSIFIIFIPSLEVCFAEQNNTFWDMTQPSVIDDVDVV